MFGEYCITELTDMQTKALSLAQLYDVVRNGVSMHYGEDESKTSIPDSVLPFPGKLLKWYNSWQEETKRAQKLKAEAAGKPGKRKLTSILKNEDTDQQAFAAFARARKEKNKPSTEQG